LCLAPTALRTEPPGLAIPLQGGSSARSLRREQLLERSAELMNLEIQLAFTFEISSDCAAPIAQELSRLKQVLVESGESFEVPQSPQPASVSHSCPTEEFS